MSMSSREFTRKNMKYSVINFYLPSSVNFIFHTKVKFASLSIWKINLQFFREWLSSSRVYAGLHHHHDKNLPTI
jgi:hypothetical protein